MPDYVINQLSFLSNDKTILAHIKSRHAGNESPAQFSLNSIQAPPAELLVPLSEPVVTLAVMNMEMPDLNEKTRQRALEKVFLGNSAKASQAAIQKKIEATRRALIAGKHNGDMQPGFGLAEFEQAAANFGSHNFFCLYDWRMHTWGTLEDIHAVTPTTFVLPTTCIEFETAWTPPIAALQLLSNAFPSVRFRLKYRYAGDPWTEVEFFPFPPFGY